MACTLYLVRHGIAASASANTSDADRALTEQGTRKTIRVAHGLRGLNVKPAAILSSPLRRAQETAEIMASILAPKVPVELYPALAFGHEPRDVLQGLRSHRRAEQVMLVGHQPDMGELASFLLTGSSNLVPLPFKKAATAAITVPSLPPRSAGVLEWFLTPAQLRRIGRS
jgi:phosphohistidine phosphatase